MVEYQNFRFYSISTRLSDLNEFENPNFEFNLVTFQERNCHSIPGA